MCAMSGKVVAHQLAGAVLPASVAKIAARVAQVPLPARL
jgi:hypothetical protein